MMEDSDTSLNIVVAFVLGIGLVLGLLTLLSGQVAPAVAAPALSGAEGPIPGGKAARPELTSGAVITVCREGGCDYDVIQDAVDAATNGDEIRVATGGYTEVNTRADKQQVVYINKAVSIRGGYTTTNWTTSDPAAYPTVLDAGGQGRVLYIIGDISPTIAGLHITGGDAEGLGGGFVWTPIPDAGGGVYVRTADPVIVDCQVYSNVATVGGGLYLQNSAARFSGSTVSGNSADKGGGLFVVGGAATISANTIAGNSAEFGGGLYLWSTHASVIGNTVRGNSGSAGGGLCVIGEDGVLIGNTVAANTADWCAGVYLYESSATLTGNTVTLNDAQQGGGGLCVWEGETGGDPRISRNAVTANTAARQGGGVYLSHSGAVLTNTLVADNEAQSSGSGLYLKRSARLLHTTIVGTGWREADPDGDGVGVWVNEGELSMTNTVLVGHTTGVSVAGGAAAALDSTLWGDGVWANENDWDGEGTISTGPRNFWGDPAFVDPNGGDYHIGRESTAVDRAVDTPVSNDIDDHPRPLGPHSDLGADEYTWVDLSGSTKTAAPDQAGANEVITYTIALSNSGLFSAVNAVLYDAVPAHTSYVSRSAQASEGSIDDAGSISWTGTLVPDQPITVTFRVTVNEATFIENTALITDQYGTTTRLTGWVNASRYYLPLVLRGAD